MQVLILAVTAGLAGTLLVAAILGHTLNDGPGVASLLIGLACLATTTTALTIAGRSSLVEHDQARRGAPWLLDAATGALGIGALAVVLVWDLAGVRATSPWLIEIVGLILWCSFGCSMYAFHLLRATTTSRERGARATQVIVVPAVAIAVAVCTAGAGGDPALAFRILERALTFTSFAAILIVPTLLVRAGLAGLAKSRDRAQLVGRVLPDGPGRATGFLLAKAAALLVLAAVVPLWHPGAVLLSPSPVSWVGALVAAGLVVLLLWFDHRAWPVRRDLKVLSAAGGLILAIPLGVLVAVAFAMGMGPAIAANPWQAASVVLVALASWLPAHRRAGSWRRGVEWIVAAAVGAAGWSTLGRAPAVPMSTGPVTGPSLDLAIIVFVCSLVLLAGSFIAVAVARRQTRLLTYLAAVVVWVTLKLTFPAWTPGVLPLDIDLALIALLCLGMLGHARGVVRRIDPAEAVVVSVATLFAMDAPELLRSAPEDWTTWVLAIGALTAIGLDFWFELPAMARQGGDGSPLRSLSLTCLVVALTATLAWSVGAANRGLPEGMAQIVLGFVSLPLAVVLASQSLQRPGREVVTPVA
ncbi:MAG TPA: hypothetical protein VGK18_13185 [Propionicimonas sp.]|uniref:hypothetical protein n=1 Tax=Propionicimonas sp. TaxID=1955623 RepID=UPI002F40DF1F